MHYFGLSFNILVGDVLAVCYKIMETKFQFVFGMGEEGVFIGEHQCGHVWP